MKITQQQLKVIIKEEYARILLENSGKKFTENHVKQLAEGLDEGLFGNLLKSLSSAAAAGKETFKTASQENKAAAAAAALDQIKSDLGKKMKDALSSVAKDLQSKVGLEADDAADKAHSMLTIAVGEVVPELAPAASEEAADIDVYSWLMGDRDSGVYPKAGSSSSRKPFRDPKITSRAGSAASRGQMRRASGF